MSDPTEDVRRLATAVINADPGSRKDLESRYGDVWDTSELQKNFSVLAFAAPFCIVSRKSDNTKGTVTFQHDPRYYYDFQPE